MYNKFAFLTLVIYLITKEYNRHVNQNHVVSYSQFKNLLNNVNAVKFLSYLLYLITFQDHLRFETTSQVVNLFDALIDINHIASHALLYKHESYLLQSDIR